MIPKIIVLLDSGGLDSTVLKYWLHAEGHKVHSLLVDYGQKHVQELECARYHSHRLGLLYTRITVSQLRGSTLTDGTGGVIVPCRNPVLLSLAVNLAASIGADTVCFGANKDDEAEFPDCRMAFVQNFNNMLTTAEVRVEVCAPFFDKPKWAIVGLAQELGVELEQTWSCYRGGKKPCGECPACQKRIASMEHK